MQQPYKLAFTTLGCPEWSWNKILDEAAKMGYQGLEIRGLEGEMDLPKAAPFLPQNRSRTRDELAKRGLAVCCLGSAVRFHDADALDENIDSGKAYIDLAADMDIPYVRVFGDKISDPESEGRIVDQVVRGLNQLGAYAQGTGVAVVIETHGDFSRSERLARVMKQVDAKDVGVLWDLHHPWRFHGEYLEDSFEALAPWIRHTHVKDSISVGDGYRYCLFGQGEFPALEAISLLRQRGYDGWISLEWEKKWHPEIEEPEVAFPQFVEAFRKYEQEASQPAG